MSEQLGKIEKPSVDEFKLGRKLYFVPLIFRGQETPAEFTEKYDNYWKQVEEQIGNLELKLGKPHKIYHELYASGDEKELDKLKEMNEKSHQLIQDILKKGAHIENTESEDLLTEVMDWSRCLSIGLSNHNVMTKVYEYYREASKKRFEYISKQLNETLKQDEIGILFMTEGHEIQFPADIQVIYVSPPALDEIKRWVRDYEAKQMKEEKPT